MPPPARRDRRIYAYVCRYNNGNAPNLWRGNFTLAACKGPIRKHARPGDVVIGFQQKDGLAPLFAFRVEERLEWPAYVRRCEDSLRGSKCRFWACPACFPGSDLSNSLQTACCCCRAAVGSTPCGRLLFDGPGRASERQRPLPRQSQKHQAGLGEWRPVVQKLCRLVQRVLDMRRQAAPTG